MKKIILIVIILFSMTLPAEILIPMDSSQANHLKAYGVAFEGLKQKLVIKWLLNY
ncbi:MAG TPA: asparagine synthetase B, partial [Candidatus Cloacimonas sp.]|nr:asparagine synthetase B [Candidatus Cloacimonas sp.]